MKKILSAILAMAMICGMFTFGATAAGSSAEVAEDLQMVMKDYMFLAEFCGGYFAEGGSPSSGAISTMAKWEVMEEDYNEYLVKVDEYGFKTYNVPADVFEEKIVFSYYAKNDAILETLHASSFYHDDGDAPYYDVFIGGGFGGPLPKPVLQSYVLRDDGLYEAYALLVDPLAMGAPSESGEYVPFEDDVEGEDYIVIWNEGWGYDEETQTSYPISGYIPAKLIGGLKVVVDLKDGYSHKIYHAFEEIAKEDIPEGGNVIVPEEKPDYVDSISGATLEVSRDTFDVGVSITASEYYDEESMGKEEYQKTAEVLKDYGKVVGVYEFEATKDGETVQPETPITATFSLPEEYSPDVSVYYVSDDGQVEVIDTEITTDVEVVNGVTYTSMHAVAKLTHFSRYAVVGTLFADVNEDGSVNLSDITEMLKSVAGWNVSPNKIAMDADRDGKVNLNDITLAMKYIAGWNVRFGTEYKEEPDISGWNAPDYVDVQLIDVNEYSRPGTKLEKVNGIVVHYVANPGTSAAANRSYFAGLAQSGATYASSNFIIGLEGEVLQCVPANEVAYASNSRNYDTLSIENCHPDETGKFNDATYNSLVRLCADICIQFDLDPMTDIIRHHDVTGKLCPKYYVENVDAWHAFLEDVAEAVAQ